MTIYQTENKERRLMILTVLGQKYYLAFHKGQFLVHFFLIFFLADLFFVLKDISSYGDNITPFLVENNIDNVIGSFSDALLNWFKNDFLKNNIHKYNVLVQTNL